MKTPQQYSPGAANLARIEKDGENWTLVLVRQLRHPPSECMTPERPCRLEFRYQC
jgi:hypothetical protein